MSFFFPCLDDGPIETCEGQTVSLDPSGFRKITTEVVDLLLVLIKNFFMRGGSYMSLNMLRAANSLRCALVSGAENSWYLLAAAYYLSRFYGMEAEVVRRLDKYYPYICSCTAAYADMQETQHDVSPQVVALFETCSETQSLDNYFDGQFDVYLANYGKSYETRAEYDTHMAAFRDSSKTMWTHNERYASGEETFGMSWNKYSDYTAKQWTLMLQTRKLANDVSLMLTEEPMDEEEMDADLERFAYTVDRLSADPVNWAEERMVTEVKDQGICGAGYAFAIVGALESMQAINRGNLVNLSPQQILDCDQGYNSGCHGGAMTYALSYAVEQGLMYEAHYPYRSYDYAEYLGNDRLFEQACQFAEDMPRMEFPRYAYQLPRGRPDLLLEMIQKQPVAVLIDASSSQFRQYSGDGVITGLDCGENPNHAVLAVGYGNEDGNPYVLIKNSWGEDWGDNGYAKIGISFDARRINGICGMMVQAVVPKMEFLDTAYANVLDDAIGYEAIRDYYHGLDEYGIDRRGRLADEEANGEPEAEVTEEAEATDETAVEDEEAETTQDEPTLYHWVACQYDSEQGQWHDMDGAYTCPQESPYNGEACKQDDDGLWRTSEGALCPTKDYHQAYSDCKYNEEYGEWFAADSTVCNWEVTYEFMCWVKTDQMMNLEYVWEPLEDVDCPSTITYYGTFPTVSFEDYSGYFFHWYEVDPWQPDVEDLYASVLCFFDEESGLWWGENGEECPQEDQYSGDGCEEDSDGQYVTSDGVLCPNQEYHQNYGCEYDHEQIGWYNKDGERCNYETTYEFFCLQTRYYVEDSTIAANHNCPMSVTYYGSFEDPSFVNYDGYLYPYDHVDITPKPEELNHVVVCFPAYTAVNSWVAEDGTACPSAPPKTSDDDCYERDDGQSYTRGGEMCPTEDYAWHGGECHFDADLDQWVSHNEDEICHYTTLYEYVCAYQDATGTWVEESAECPEVIVYYNSDERASYEAYEGYFFPFAPAEEPKPLHKWIECYRDDDGHWHGFDHQSGEDVECPQENIYHGEECKDSGAASYTSDGVLCPNDRWEWNWDCWYDYDDEIWRDANSMQCDWSTTYYFVCWYDYSDLWRESLKTEYMIYHAHWQRDGLGPQPIWFHYNTEGDCKFSIGGSNNADVNGFGKCDVDADAITLVFERAKEHERVFTLVDDFGWGPYEPEATVKYQISDTDQFYLWKVVHEEAAVAEEEWYQIEDCPAETTYYGGHEQATFEEYEGYFMHTSFEDDDDEEPVTPSEALYQWVDCVLDASDGRWYGEFGEACPQEDLYNGEECVVSDGEAPEEVAASDQYFIWMPKYHRYWNGTVETGLPPLPIYGMFGGDFRYDGEFTIDVAKLPINGTDVLDEDLAGDFAFGGDGTAKLYFLSGESWKIQQVDRFNTREPESGWEIKSEEKWTDGEGNIFIWKAVNYGADDLPNTHVAWYYSEDELTPLPLYLHVETGSWEDVATFGIIVPFNADENFSGTFKLDTEAEGAVMQFNTGAIYDLSVDTTDLRKSRYTDGDQHYVYGNPFHEYAQATGYGYTAGAYYTADGVLCPAPNFGYQYGCKLNDAGVYTDQHGDECKFETTYVFACEDGYDSCPNTVMYYKQGEAASFENFEGYYYPDAEWDTEDEEEEPVTDEWVDVGHTVVLECHWAEEAGMWMTEERVHCPDYRNYEGVSCKFDATTETWRHEEYMLCPDEEYYQPEGCDYVPWRGIWVNAAFEDCMSAITFLYPHCDSDADPECLLIPHDSTWANVDGVWQYSEHVDATSGSFDCTEEFNFIKGLPYQQEAMCGSVDEVLAECQAVCLDLGCTALFYQEHVGERGCDLAPHGGYQVCAFYKSDEAYDGDRASRLDYGDGSQVCYNRQIQY